MNEGIGKLLSTAREEKGLTIEQVAKETKIQKRYILDMEEEKFEDLPGKTYEKGFLKTYGALLEIDRNMLIEMYNKRQGNSVIQEKKSETEEKKSPKSNGMLMLLLSGVLLIAVGAFMMYKFVIGDYTARDKKKVVTEQVVEIKAEKMDMPELEEAAKEQAEEIKEEIKEEGKAENQIVEVVGTEVASAEKKVEEKKEIILKLNGTSWLEIKKNGKRIFYDNAKKGEIKVEGKADDKIYIKVGDSSKVEIVYNGESMGILGKEKEIYKKTF